MPRLTLFITLIETNKALLKDEEAEDVDVYLYRSMIGSLMYLTDSRPDIMFAVCACLWYPKDSPFDLETFSDSNYAGASLDKKSTTGEYVAAANCRGQVLWIQNQMLDYGFNFMNTKIYIDNESIICIVKNLVYHSKTKHIEIRHHFIRDSYEKRHIQVIKIHTDHNIADLLKKMAFVMNLKFKLVVEQILVLNGCLDWIATAAKNEIQVSDVSLSYYWLSKAVWMDLRIIGYLKGQPKLGLWYPRDSPFNLEAFSDSDYVRPSLDRKTITEGCQFLGKRLISWQCKKQTVVTNSTTKVEYIAAASCCGQMASVMNLEFKLVVEQRFILNGCLDWIATTTNNEIQVSAVGLTYYLEANKEGLWCCLYKTYNKGEEVIKDRKTSQARRKPKIVVSDEEVYFEDTSKQRRSMIEEIDQDTKVTLVTPIQGAQRDHEAEVFQVSNDDTAVAQRWLEDKQPEEKTNTDYLVNEQENKHLGAKVGANIMVTGVPGQEGAEGDPQFEVPALDEDVEYRFCLSVTPKVEIVVY
uniref:Uncharacterized protein n=1 Tax=Tanacetum cinerariifolium TaxID=118510 RepID=A0A6L2M9Y0_TANCI|nr:hypothetical protein [Tanacetum cinerariifolium]